MPIVRDALSTPTNTAALSRELPLQRAANNSLISPTGWNLSGRSCLNGLNEPG